MRQQILVDKCICLFILVTKMHKMRVKNKIIETKLYPWKKLIPFQPDNLKNISNKNIDRLKYSMLENGFSSPFYCWEKNGKVYILDGHHRFFLMKEIEKDVVIPKDLPIVILDIKTKKEANEILMIFNSHYADFNLPGLRDFSQAFDKAKFDFKFNLFKTGLNYKKKERFELAEPRNNVPIVCSADDKISLGDHVIYVQPCFHSHIEKVHMAFADPPYDLDSLDWVQDCIDVVQGDIFIMHNDRKIIEICASHIDKFVSLFSAVSKAQRLVSSNMPIKDVDTIAQLRTTKKGNFKNRSDNFRQSIFVNKVHKKVGDFNGHNQHKSVNLPYEFILHYTDEGQSVLDPFLGVGSTLLACEKLGRKCVGWEIEPKYVSVIIDRWLNLTGENYFYVNDKKYDFRDFTDRY